MERFDVVVVGAGIVGLAQALAASRRVERVLVVERNAVARGASVRNFGMVWPIGQPAGPLLRRAIRSRDIWLECASTGAFSAQQCGALHVAMRLDEMEVLTEFHERHKESGYQCRLLTGSQACAACPALRRDRVLGALFSELELCVDPREAVAALPRVLADRGVRFMFARHVRATAPGRIELSDGISIAAERIIVCAGAEMRTLFPDVLARSGLVACKLQMLRTAPQPQAWRLGPHVAAGLTLVHYQAFAECTSLALLKRRFQDQYRDHLAAGVHVLVSQNSLGELTLGDSHEYTDEPAPFDSAPIERMVLDYLAEFFCCPNPAIAQRWHGVYAKHRGGATEYVARVDTGVYLVTGLGGAGMSLSFGLAEETIDAILADQPWTPPPA